jgi:integrase
MTRGEGRQAQKRGAWGTVHELPSGRWRALYYGPDGARGPRYKAPKTFRTKGEARQWLTTMHADIIRKTWIPPDAAADPATSQQTLADYAETWLPNRLIDGEPLKDRTAEMYRMMLDTQILPVLGDKPVASITADDVRAWHAATLVGRPAFRARCYGLLRTILATAVTDGKLAVNPCTIRGAGSARRQVTIEPATLDELAKLVDAMPEQYRVMVLLAAWCAMRYGELTELRRKDIDLEEGVVRIRRGVVYIRQPGPSHFVVTTPKSKSAGRRDVWIPPHLLPAVRDHLVDHTEPGAESLLFPAFKGGHLHQATLQQIFGHAREAAGRPDLRFHDLRHTGAVLAASTGATLAELMARLGHSTVGAALRYQHAAQGADKRIAAALSKLADTPAGSP